ncbi:Protein kinase, catalytic domain-containing protein [Artemisia annua]|uniref:non-specific serine/threonine protein kinase n=1 Tax=Artemisia annua TaxID=35608 RepID=A0A2U1NNA7_ARTAN|nr:Protein kinase, catalytic domain-containing protein [Artemisia annua]
MEDEHYTTLSNQGSDLDFSFTSSTTNSIATTSARSSLARSSLSLSFNESTRISSVSTTTSSTEIPNYHSRPHRKSDPNWSAIKAATNLSADGKLHMRHLKLVRHVGSGNLGRVFLCKLRDYNHANFALKVVDNNLLTSKKWSHVQTEARILSVLDHPFLPTLYAHFEASHYTCFLIDYCPNGDLHSLLRKQPKYRFHIDSIRFFAAEVLVALEYLHSLGIVYRDLKPENILIREDGHIMLSDFDLCFNADVTPKVDTLRKLNGTLTEFVSEPTTAFSKSCVGTHEYLAPELVNGNGHGNGVDWWAFGVLIYELLNGTTPFRGNSKESTLRNITTKKVHFKEDVTNNISTAHVQDLITKLLVKDPKERLGCARGATDIKQHPFFNGLKWPLIRNYQPPEVKGLTVKKSSISRASHVGGWPLLHKKRRWLWKGLNCILLKSKGSKHNLNVNQNCYHYKHTRSIKE